LGRVWKGRCRVTVHLVPDVERLAAHRRYLDSEDGSKRALVGVPLENSTRCLEDLRDGRIFCDPKAHLGRTVEVTL
jgi:hypothetical protein